MSDYIWRKKFVFDLWGEMSCILVEINRPFQAGFSGVVFYTRLPGSASSLSLL